jgi:hypothetical protein
LRRTLFAALLIVTPIVHAASITPLTLWELIDRSELIVLADVQGVERLGPGEGAGDWNSHRARLKVVERWKGEGGPELTLAFPGNLACPAPPLFDSNRRVLAFLAHDGNELVTVGLASGTRYPRGPEEVSAYRAAVSEALGLQDPGRGRPTSAAQRRAWDLRRIVQPVTRSDGLAGLRGSTATLSDEERRTLAAAFVAAPPQDDALPWMLRALRPPTDAAVTDAAVSALDAVLRSPRIPSWSEEALELVRERLGEEGPPKAPVDPLQGSSVVFMARRDGSQVTAPGRIRDQWVQLKERFRLAPAPLPSVPRSDGARATCEPLLEVAENPGRREALEPVSMLRVARSCAVAPQAVTSWFPRHQLKVVMETARASDAEHVERVVGPRRCELGAVLWSYREPVLVNWADGEAYRVVWRPSFGPPVVFRVLRTAGQTTAVLADRIRGEALSGRFEAVVRPVNDADFGPFAGPRTPRVLAAWAHLPGGPERRSGGVSADGNSWLLEARNGEHWSVDVDDPRSGPFLDVAMAVVRAAWRVVAHSGDRDRVSGQRPTRATDLGSAPRVLKRERGPARGAPTGGRGPVTVGP